MGLQVQPGREEVLRYLGFSSAYGNLCLFVGAGFSKELVGADALSWGALLQQAALQMGIAFDFSHNSMIGVGYPEVASLMCLQHSQMNSISYQASLSALKREVAELTSWYPDEDRKSFYADKLMEISPSWIVTTNYDLVLESLLHVASVTIGPSEPLVFPKGRIPVYHLHGVRTDPEGIVIAREDYTVLFRPNEYRQIKLALTLKESTTLLLGYGLGDDNVLTAYDWSRNVYDYQSETYPHAVIQIVRAASPRDRPYRTGNGVLVLETPSLEVFFEELMPFIRERKEKDRLAYENLTALERYINTNTASAVELFLDDQARRTEILGLLRMNHASLIHCFIPFFERCVDQAFIRSSGNGQFQGYSECLTVILDVMMAYADTNVPPALFQKIAHAFNRLAPYIGRGMGQSHNSYRQWSARKVHLQYRHLRELKTYSRRKRWEDVLKLLAEFNLDRY
ncbi:SIR2 family protein [Pseudomonas sp. TH21]|uniref:SIR2 family NAD-dependent protein deacylase n=1 Tax=Pseudomonas sp. TH21 TaxID=2796387 RepID=UPI0019139B6B|nr:SIR2 family protein [Pseudomonas sp. TH21]MBK5477467.1 SIR2 family protein [Pseudomonas sp. TH21]